MQIGGTARKMRNSIGSKSEIRGAPTHDRGQNTSIRLHRPVNSATFLLPLLDNFSRNLKLVLAYFKAVQTVLKVKKQVRGIDGSFESASDPS